MNLLSLETCRYILQDILDKSQYLPIALAAGALAGMCLHIFIRRGSKCQKGTLLVIYFIMLFILTIFEREPGSRTEMNLVIFGTLGNARANAYVVENILLFIPFGIMASWTWRSMRSPLLCTVTGLCLSAGIEIIQLLTERGYFQVDDILTNTLGTCIGSSMLWLLRLIFRRVRLVFHREKMPGRLD